MHSTKPDFKKMTETERKEFLKEFKKTVAASGKTRTTGDKKKPVKYLDLNKTPRPVPMATMNDYAIEKSMKKYHEHIQSMVALGFTNPSDPSFRNDVMKNMKELHNANPKNIIPMHNKEWVVNSIIQKVYQNVNKNNTNKPQKTTVKTQDVKKTKQMFEARRKALAAKKRKQTVAAAAESNKNNNNNGREGFNMNNMSNNNNTGSKSNNNNNNGRNSNTNNNVRSMTHDDVKKLMNNLKRLNMSVVRV